MYSSDEEERGESSTTGMIRAALETEAAKEKETRGKEKKGKGKEKEKVCEYTLSFDIYSDII